MKAVPVCSGCTCFVYETSWANLEGITIIKRDTGDVARDGAGVAIVWKQLIFRKPTLLPPMSRWKYFLFLPRGYSKRVEASTSSLIQECSLHTSFYNPWYSPPSCLLLSVRIRLTFGWCYFCTDDDAPPLCNLDWLKAASDLCKHDLSRPMQSQQFRCLMKYLPPATKPKNGQAVSQQ